MIKNNKWKCIISSIIVLLPMFAGILLWDSLPNSIAVHWNAAGNADGFGSKTTAVFIIPCIMLALHWLCLVITSFDKGNKNQNKKAMNLVYWIIPMTSVFANGTIYLAILEKEVNMYLFVSTLIGITFIAFGNYMPKLKRNSTMGVKVSWAINNEENWNKTHRFAGRLWFFGGFLVLFSGFLPTDISLTVLFVVLLVLSFLPMLYSYCLYRKQLAERTYEELPLTPFQQHWKKLSIIFTVLILIGVGILMFTGNIKYQFNDTSFTIEASYYEDMTVNYADIDSIDYYEELDRGVRTNGFGSPTLVMGIFNNEEFGRYVLYGYSGCDNSIVLKNGENVLVISGKNNDETRKLYDELMERVYE